MTEFDEWRTTVKVWRPGGEGEQLSMVMMGDPLVALEAARSVIQSRDWHDEEPTS